MQPVQTPSSVVSTPQRARGASVSAMMTMPESVLNPGLANGDISRESMDTDMETPLPSQGAGTSSSSLVNPPPSATTTAPAPAQTSNRRSGKKKKKRGRKPKDKSQVDNSTATNNTQGTATIESGGVHVQQQNAVDQNSRTPVGGAVVGGASGHHTHAGDDALRTSREPMEVESRRSIGSSSSISVPPLPLHNPHHLNNSYASNQALPASETGQSRLTDRHRAPSAMTPSRESVGAGTVGGLPLGPGGVVRIKQEPITNHEEEMETNQPPAHQHQRQPTTKVSNTLANHF